MVWLKIKNLFATKLSRKLENHHAGKYFVNKVISPYAVKLDLFLNICIYLVFYINFLESVNTNLFYLGYMQFFKFPIQIERKIEYEISIIINFHYFEKV